jgi:glycosyltransferase involved in cell wall biosynthesis
MKIGILGSRGFPSTYGGYETLVRHLARWLVKEGHDVTVYCRARAEERRAWIIEDVRCIATPGYDSKSFSTLTYGATASLNAAWRRFDAMLVLNIANGFYLPLLRRRGIPVAVNTDGVEWARGKWGRAAKAVFRAGAAQTAKHATALIADSRAIAAIWQKEFGVSSEFIPYGAPVLTDVKSDGLEELGLTSGEYALVVARLIPENNVEIALDAIELLRRESPKTVIVGSANFDSPIESRLRQMEKRDQVCWLGHVHDQRLLTRLWAHCGVYYHGHSVGGTNPALVQALGAGAPVIALDTPFNREVVRSSELLFSGDPKELAKRIESLLHSKDEQARLRRHGQLVVSEHYQWPDVCERYFRVLQRIAEYGTPSTPKLERTTADTPPEHPPTKLAAER